MHFSFSERCQVSPFGHSKESDSEAASEREENTEGGLGRRGGSGSLGEGPWATTLKGRVTEEPKREEDGVRRLWLRS